MVTKNKSIIVQDVEIQVKFKNNEDYISLTDMAKARTDSSRAADVIKNWLRSRTTLEFLGTWESLHNPNFKVVEFDHFKNKAGLHTFTISAKEWIEKTQSIGIYVQSGRYGGTYAHKDIAFEFGSAISPVFKLYLIKEFQRLKEQELQTNNLEWNIRRILTKTNYRIHTDAVKENLIPKEISKFEENLIYASEADLLNKALFNMTAKEWRDKNPEKEGNIRDYATVEQLVVLSTLESQNALLIRQGFSRIDRLKILNELAIEYMKSILESPSVKKIQNTSLLS